jgi:hypothetical protein
MLSLNPATHDQILTVCGRSDNLTFAGTGRGTGFSGPNKELAGQEERGFRGSKGQQRGQFITIRLVSTVFRLQYGALATGWTSAPLGV